MKNIALIIPSLKGGGAERVVSILSQELSQKYNVYLIVFDSQAIAYQHGGTLIDLNIKSSEKLFMKILNVIRRVFRVRRIKRDYSIHFSISFLDSANIVNILSRRNEKVIISVHSHLSKRVNNFYGQINKLLIRLLYNKADSVIAISKGVAQDLCKEYGLIKEIVSHIYNPIDIPKIKKFAQESLVDDTFDDRCFTIITVGRLTYAKGQWHLIRAFDRVRKKIYNARLIVLGQGPLDSYLKQLVKDLQLENSVFFMGFVNNPFKFVKNSDVFVFPSLYEGFGNVIIEALACGTPVIASDCRSGPREILAPNTAIECETDQIEYAEYGILVPVCNGTMYDHTHPLTREEKILADSILELYNNKQLMKKYSIKGQERVKDFEVKCILPKWEEILIL